MRSSHASESLTIGRLARAADVGVETVRYYQERALLPVPPSNGAFRYYPIALVERIRFIKRAQELGFSLEEIKELLLLEEGADRAAIRRVAGERLLQISAKLADLRRIQRVLATLLAECEHTDDKLPCPIIGTLRRRSVRSPESTFEAKGSGLQRDPRASGLSPRPGSTANSRRER